jgi:CRISPR-associated protein Cas5t
MEKDGFSLLVSVPVCSFRKGYAREYLETEEIPPPSTVYGFLLSLIGEEDRKRYVGTRIAYALMERPELSVVIRTAWRIKQKKLPVGVGSNRRPDYQEILTRLELGIWIDEGELAEKLREASSNPGNIWRHGGLSLGESRDLVNDVQWLPEWSIDKAQWLTLHPRGELTLPVWVDHVGSKGTVWKQFHLEPNSMETPPPEDPRWIPIIASQSG